MPQYTQQHQIRVEDGTVIHTGARVTNKFKIKAEVEGDGFEAGAIRNLFTYNRSDYRYAGKNLNAALAHRDREAFYKLMPYNYNDTHEPKQQDIYNVSDEGLRNYIQDNTAHSGGEIHTGKPFKRVNSDNDFCENAYNVFITLLVKDIEEILGLEVQNKDELPLQDSIQIRAGLTSPEDQDENELPTPEILEDALLVTESGTRRVELSEPSESVKSLSDLEQSLENRFRQRYEAQLNSRVNTLQQQIEEKEEEIEEAKSEAFMQGIQVLNELDDNWQVKNGKILYDDTIHATHVDKAGTRYELTEEGKERFYIEKPYIRIEKHISRAGFEGDARHVNASGHICIGGLRGSDLKTVLQQLPTQLKSMNPDSALDSSLDWKNYTKYHAHKRFLRDSTIDEIKEAIRDEDTKYEADIALEVEKELYNPRVTLIDWLETYMDSNNIDEAGSAEGDDFVIDVQ